MKMRLSKPAFVVDIGRISGLDKITEEGNSFILGALVTHADRKFRAAQIEMSLLRKPQRPSPTFRCAAAPSAAASPRRPGRRLASDRHGARRGNQNRWAERRTLGEMMSSSRFAG
jgi:hypothetical protein